MSTNETAGHLLFSGLQSSESGNRGYASGPERGLLSALLFDGVMTCLGNAGSAGISSRRKYQEAMLWLSSSDQSYIFSFENVCEGLGVDAAALRAGIASICKSRLQAFKRARRHD